MLPELTKKRKTIKNQIKMKTTIQIKSIFGKILFSHETEDNSIKKTVIKAVLEKANLSGANLIDVDLSGANLQRANLIGANLIGADLRDVDLSGANLQRANLIGVDLREADLREADLREADLREANLRGACTSKKYIQISCIGSAKRMTTYCFEYDIVWCGCFKGNLEQFERQVLNTHDKNSIYRKEYIGFIKYLKSLK